MLGNRNSQEHVDGKEPGAFFIVEDILRARLALRRNKAAGEGELVAEMIQDTDAMAWNATVAFNQRVLSFKEPRQSWQTPATEEAVAGSFQDSAPGGHSGHQRKGLELHLLPLERWGTACSPSHLGFRKARSSAVQATTVRLVLGKHMEWMLPESMAQVDFVRAYDSVRHASLLKPMLQRGWPRPLALPYLREARHAFMTFDSSQCRATLRLFGSSDALSLGAARLLGSLAHPVGGIRARPPPLQQGAHTLEADATWLFSATSRHFERMMCDLYLPAEAEVGLDIRGRSARLRSSRRTLLQKVPSGPKTPCIPH